MLLKLGAAAFVFEETSFDARRPGPSLAADFLARGAFGGFGFARPIVQGLEEALAGEFAILGLGTSILDRNRETRWNVAQDDFRGGFIDVLTARPRGAFEDLLQLSFDERRDFPHLS